MKERPSNENLCDVQSETFDSSQRSPVCTTSLIINTVGEQLDEPLRAGAVLNETSDAMPGVTPRTRVNVLTSCLSEIRTADDAGISSRHVSQSSSCVIVKPNGKSTIANPGY